MEEKLKELKRLREEKKIGLDEIHKKTKIPKDKLEALEEGRLDLLPEPVFVIGYVEKYLKVLGEDPEPLLSEIKDHLRGSKSEVIPPVMKEIKVKRGWPKVLGALAMFVLIAFLAYVYNGSRKKESQKIRIIGAEKVRLPNEGEKATPKPLEGEKERVKAPEKENKSKPTPTTATISAMKGPCWIRYLDSSGNVKEFFLREGDSIKDKLPITLRAGNAGSLAIKLGEKVFSGLGKQGEIVNIKIKKDGIERLTDVPEVLKTPFPKVQ